MDARSRRADARETGAVDFRGVFRFRGRELWLVLISMLVYATICGLMLIGS